LNVPVPDVTAFSSQPSSVSLHDRYDVVVQNMAATSQPQRLVLLCRDLVRQVASIPASELPSFFLTRVRGGLSTWTPVSAWHWAKLLRAQGNALFHEGYYLSAFSAYVASLETLEACKHGQLPESDLAQHEFSCQLNCALCFLKRGAEWAEGIRWCDRALETSRMLPATTFLDKALFRKGQLLMGQRMYEKARAVLSAVTDGLPQAAHAAKRSAWLAAHHGDAEKRT
jgi:tetratricopeptide (TPR) repeat protein